MSLYRMKSAPVREVTGPLPEDRYVPILVSGSSVTQRIPAGSYLLYEPEEILPRDQYGNPTQHFQAMTADEFLENWEESPDE